MCVLSRRQAIEYSIHGEKPSRPAEGRESTRQRKMSGFVIRYVLAGSMALLSLFVALPALAQSTGSTGSGQAFDLGQPGLGVTQVVATSGSTPDPSGGADPDAIGLVHTFVGNYGPNGTPFADGRLLLIDDNVTLFTLLEDFHGGDGVTTFALPDLRGRFLVGTGAGSGLPPADLGAPSGAPVATLTDATMAAHAHLLSDGVTKTLPAGGSSPLDIRAPALPLTVWIAIEGVFPLPSGTTVSPFLGEIRWFAGNFTPEQGWMPADGRLLLIAQHEMVFSLIGTTYGGDGETTFALPDLRGRVPVGSGTGPFGAVQVGELFGSTEVALTANQLPTHQHTVDGSVPTQSTGGDQPLTLFQPSLGITWLVARQGIFPPFSGNGNFPASEPFLGQIIAFAGNFAPGGYSMAAGQLLPINQNQALFAIIGTTYGGNGQTNFALPDLRGRSPVGAGAESVPQGQHTGSASIILQVANLPAHVHSLVDSNDLIFADGFEL